MKEIYIPDIGIVKLNKNGKARKNFNIRVSQNGMVEVSVPSGQSNRDARNMVISMKDKILRSQKKLKKQLHQQKQNITVFRRDTVFKTREHHVKITTTSAKTASYYINPDNNKFLVINIPQHLDIEHKHVQIFIRQAIENFWRLQASLYIPERVSVLAGEHNLNFSGIGITKARTRWGSCSSKNKLNFSLHMMMLPDELIDYVILHELAHTIHKNHSRDFHTLLHQLTDGKHQKYREKLKTYRIGVY